jgi:hypothetical protein
MKVNWYTKELLEKNNERKRLTNSLVAIVNEVAHDIAYAVPTGAASSPYEVIRIETVTGSEKFLAIKVNGDHLVFSSQAEPESSFLCMNDIKVGTVSREQYLTLANNLPEVIEAFSIHTDKGIHMVRRAFNHLKAYARVES